MGTRKRLVPQLLVASSCHQTHLMIRKAERVIAYTKPVGITHKVISIKPIWKEQLP